MENSKGYVGALVKGYVANLRRFRNYVYSDDTVITAQDDAVAIKAFPLDVDCLDPLAEWSNILLAH